MATRPICRCPEPYSVIERNGPVRCTNCGLPTEQDGAMDVTFWPRSQGRRTASYVAVQTSVGPAQMRRGSVVR